MSNKETAVEKLEKRLHEFVEKIFHSNMGVDGAHEMISPIVSRHNLNVVAEQAGRHLRRKKVIFCFKDWGDKKGARLVDIDRFIDEVPDGSIFCLAPYLPEWEHDEDTHRAWQQREKTVKGLLDALEESKSNHAQIVGKKLRRELYPEE